MNGVGAALPPKLARSAWYDAESALNGALAVGVLPAANPVASAKVKGPLVTEVPENTSGAKVVPLTVVAATPCGPMFTAPTSVPLVLTSESPVMP